MLESASMLTVPEARKATMPPVVPSQALVLNTEAVRVTSA